jgi:hypothetical protein
MSVWSHASLNSFNANVIKHVQYCPGLKSFIMCVRPIHYLMVDNAIKIKKTINYIIKRSNADKI